MSLPPLLDPLALSLQPVGKGQDVCTPSFCLRTWNSPLAPPGAPTGNGAATLVGEQSRGQGEGLTGNTCS